MRRLILLVALLMGTVAFAQDSIPEVRQDQDMQNTQFASQSEAEPTFFILNGQEYKFIPNELGFHIMKIENGNEVDYGTLLLTSEDGYYALTSNLNDHVSYGRFENNGNFRALRYDEEEDTVLEENFVVKD